MANPYYDPPEQVAAFDAMRPRGMFASDAAGALGLSDYATPLEVYMRKVGLLPRVEANAAMMAGHMLEPAVARWYEVAVGCRLMPSGTVMHPDEPWMGATPDRIRDDGRLVELKTANGFAQNWGEEGTDEIPEIYVVQVQHQMAVLGAGRCDVAVLFAGQRFAVYTVRRDDALIDMLVKAESEFWLRVTERRPPEPDWMHPATAGLMARLYEPRAGLEVAIDNPDLADEYERLGKVRSEADANRKAVRARLIEAMGGAEFGHLPDGRRVRYYTQAVKGYTVEPSEHPELRILKPRKAK